MKRTCYLLMAFMLLATVATAQSSSSNQKFVSYKGTKGIKKRLSELKLMTALPKTEAQEKLIKEAKEKREKLRFQLDKFTKFKERLNSKKQNPSKPNSEEEKEVAKAQPTVLPTGGNTEGIWSNFQATSLDELPLSFVPDPSGDVGSSQVAIVTNSLLKIFEKRGVTDPPLETPKGTSGTLAKEQYSIPIDAFFFPLFTSQTLYTAVPHIRYDRLTKRWYITAIEVNFSFENNQVFLAVSDGDKLTDETSFTYYSFPSVQFPVSPDIEFQPFLDFPTLGTDKNSVLIGGSSYFYNAFFGIDSLYFVGYILDKKQLAFGNLIGYGGILGKIDYSSAVGMIAPQGVQNSDAQASQSFFAGINNDLNGIYVDAIDYDKNNTPVGLTETVVPVQQWNFPREVTAPGSPMPIDPFDTRLFSATIHKNKFTGKSSLWTTHAIGVDRSGNYVSDADFTEKARTASRWYEIDHLYTKPQLVRVGTQYDPTLSGRRATMYFNPSIAASGQGRVVLGGTTSAYNKYLDVFVADRYYGEKPGTLHTPALATETGAIYAPFDLFSGYVGLWGNSSQTVVDPLDDQTIWTFQEYTNVDDGYGIRAVQLKAPPPITPVPLRPLINSGNWDIVLTGESVNHSGFFDPGRDPGGPGYNRLTIKSTGGIIVGNIQIKNSTEVGCRIYAKGKAPGTYQLIITNPDGQFVVSEYEIVAENAPAQAVTAVVNKQIASRYLSSSGVYPNPTEKEFKLVVNAARDMATRIVVTDISGKQISSKAQTFGKGSNAIQLSLSGVNKGAYTVVVYNENNVVIAAHRVIKE